MTKEELERLNLLEKKFKIDSEYQEYRRLQRKAIDESSDFKPERSFMGEINGDKYYLVLPCDKLDIEKGEWKYRHYGFDMEVDLANGTHTCYCQALCDRDVKWFIERMLKNESKVNENG